MKFVPMSTVMFSPQEIEVVKYLLHTVPDVCSWSYDDMINIAIGKFSEPATIDLNWTLRAKHFANKCLSIGIGDTDSFYI